MSLQGKKVVFSGFRDEDLKDKIKKNGGTVVSDVSSLTDILVIDGPKGSISDKHEKAKQLGKRIMTKSTFIKTYIQEQKPSIWDAIFGKLEIRETKDNQNPTTLSPKTVTPKYESPDTITVSASYLIHDNGGRPWKVELTSSTFAVYRQSAIEEKGKGWAIYTGPYDKPIIKPTKYIKVFIGRDSKHGKAAFGNSILVKVDHKSYVFIGQEIAKYTFLDDIIGFKSPIYGSDVPYPYAVGTANTYLFLEDTYYPNEQITINDPYEQFYGYNTGLGRIQQRRKERLHKQKYKLSKTIIQKLL
jgi:hypothetical protein